MRGFLAFLFLGLVALAAGAVGYQAGLSAAVTTTAATGGATVVYAGGWHLGGLFLLPFAFLLFLLFLFTFFGFLAFVFGPRRHYAGYGPTGMHGGHGPMGGHDARRQWMADAHRRLHEEEAAAGTTTPGGSAPTAS